MLTARQCRVGRADRRVRRARRAPGVRRVGSTLARAARRRCLRARQQWRVSRLCWRRSTPIRLLGARARERAAAAAANGRLTDGGSGAPSCTCVGHRTTHSCWCVCDVCGALYMRTQLSLCCTGHAGHWQNADVGHDCGLSGADGLLDPLGLAHAQARCAEQRRARARGVLSVVVARGAQCRRQRAPEAASISVVLVPPPGVARQRRASGLCACVRVCVCV